MTTRFNGTRQEQFHQFEGRLCQVDGALSCDGTCHNSEPMYWLLTL
jgi:hypothetical protein